MTDQLSESAIELSSLLRLDLIGPDQVVDWATEHLEYSQLPAILEISLLKKPASTVDVSRLLAGMSAELGEAILDDESAGRIVARRLAREIVDGSLEPGL